MHYTHVYISSRTTLPEGRPCWLTGKRKGEQAEIVVRSAFAKVPADLPTRFDDTHVRILVDPSRLRSIT